MHVAYYRANALPPPRPPKDDGVRTWAPGLFTSTELRALCTTPLAESKRRSRSLDELASLKHGDSSHFVHSTIPRTGGRFEIKLRPAWCAACKANGATHTVATKLESLTASLLREGGCANARAHVEWHLMRVDPGAAAQETHVDQNAKKCYWTLIVPLTRDPAGSGTVFDKLPGRPVLNPYGSAVAFRGNVQHHGSAHPADAAPRRFLYAAITTGENWN